MQGFITEIDVDQLPHTDRVDVVRCPNCGRIILTSWSCGKGAMFRLKCGRCKRYVVLSS